MMILAGRDLRSPGSTRCVSPARENTMNDLVSRVRRLDELYLAADAARTAWINCSEPFEQERLRKEADRLWSEYEAVREQPYDTLPVVAP